MSITEWVYVWIDGTRTTLPYYASSLEVIKEGKRMKPEDIQVDLEYPRSDDRPEGVRIDLSDVRASDGIRVSYDFVRDGWSIQQPKTTRPWIEDNTYGLHEDWIETAFVQSWPFGDGTVFIEKDGTSRTE
jgi:hypothetical protein